MNLSAGYPYDLVRNGIPYDYPKLQHNRKADVVIMGGGISGALVAYSMHKAGIDCLVIDARTIGLGSTCASTSLLQYEIDTPLHKLSAQIGLHNAEKAYRLCGDAIHGLKKISHAVGNKDFEYHNSVYFAARPADIILLQREFAARKKAGFTVAWMDQDALLDTYGLVSPGAIVSELGAQTNAYTLTHALLQHVIKKGGQVYDRTKAGKITHHKKGVTLVTEEGYRIDCKKLVYATGYEAVKYTKKNIVKLSSTYATISEQENHQKGGKKDRAIFWNTADPYLYIRHTPDNRVIVGGRDADSTVAATGEAMIRRKSGLLARDFEARFPGHAFKKEFSWAGTFGSTKDGLPYIGEDPALPNSLFALGFGGNGITFSLIASEFLTDQVRGETNHFGELFSFNRYI